MTRGRRRRRSPTAWRSQTTDDASLQGATVSIGSGFVSSEDSLGFVNQNGITGSYNAHDRGAVAVRVGVAGELSDGAAVGDVQRFQWGESDDGDADDQLPGR